MGHARFGQRDILHYFRQRRRLGQRVCRIHGQRVKADHQTGQVFEEAGTAVEQSSVGDEHDRTKPQKLAGRGDQFLNIGAQGGLTPRENNGVGLAANNAQKA